MPLLNNVVAYLQEVIVLAGAKAVEVGTVAGNAAVELVKKILSLG